MSGTKKTQASTTAATAAAVEARAAASKAKEGGKEPVAYVGPDIKNVAINGTVYIDGLPEPLQEKIGDVPALKGLLVPISNLAAAGVAITTQGTALNNLYNAVSAKLQEQQKNR